MQVLPWTMILCPWWESLCFASARCRLTFYLIMLYTCGGTADTINTFVLIFFFFLFLRVFFFLLNISFWHFLFHKNRLNEICYKFCIPTCSQCFWTIFSFFLFSVRTTIIKTDALLSRTVPDLPWPWCQSNGIFFVVRRFIEGRRERRDLQSRARASPAGHDYNFRKKKITDCSRALENNITWQTGHQFTVSHPFHTSHFTWNKTSSHLSIRFTVSVVLFRPKERQHLVLWRWKLVGMIYNLSLWWQTHDMWLCCAC